MKINLLLILIFSGFISVILFADTDLIGGTELNGSGCVCHSLDRDYSVNVWVEGPDSLYVGEMGYFRMYMAGGPAEAGGYNVAGRFGTMVLVDTLSFQHPMALNELTQAFSLPFPTTNDTIYWDFGYTASDTSAEYDTIYSCGLSLIWDGRPDSLDRWNFGPKFPIKVLDAVSNVNSNPVPSEFMLNQNYPNPFNPATTISFYLPESSEISLTIFNTNGETIESIYEGELSTGEYQFKFNAKDLSSGVYFYSLKTNDKLSVKKMVVLK